MAAARWRCGRRSWVSGGSSAGRNPASRCGIWGWGCRRWGWHGVIMLRRLATMTGSICGRIWGCWLWAVCRSGCSPTPAPKRLRTSSRTATPASSWRRTRSRSTRCSPFARASPKSSASSTGMSGACGTTTMPGSPPTMTFAGWARPLPPGSRRASTRRSPAAAGMTRPFSATPPARRAAQKGRCSATKT